MSKVIAFLKDESGTTAIEYGLIAAGISVVIIATVNAIGVTLNAKFESVSTQLIHTPCTLDLKPPALRRFLFSTSGFPRVRRMRRPDVIGRFPLAPDMFRGSHRMRKLQRGTARASDHRPRSRSPTVLQPRPPVSSPCR